MLAGGTAAAKATRADVIIEPRMYRGDGDPIAIRETVKRDDVAYLDGTDAVRVGDRTEPFERWARREASRNAAESILPAIEDRFDGPVSGLGRGLAYPLFGAVVTVDHGVTRTRGGDIESEPNVSLDELVSVTPRTVTVTVSLEGRAATRSLPGAVEHGDVQED